MSYHCISGSPAFDIVSQRYISLVSVRFSVDRFTVQLSTGIKDTVIHSQWQYAYVSHEEKTYDNVIDQPLKTSKMCCKPLKSCRAYFSIQSANSDPNY